MALFYSCLFLFASTLFWCLCTYAFCDVMSLAFLLLLQMEIPSPTTGGTLEEEVIAALFTVSLGVEEEPPSGSVTEEVR